MLEMIDFVAEAMTVDTERLNTISKNLANLNTPAYKREITLNAVFNSLLHKEPVKSQQLIEIQTVNDLSQGAMKKTNNSMDVAIDGPAFFLTQTENGEQFLTRTGQLKVNDAGRLVTQQGHYIQGRGGDIFLKQSGDVIIDNLGRISQGGEIIGEFQLVSTHDSEQLEYLGGGLYRGSFEAIDEEYEQISVMQGFVEGSNVNMVNEMMQMIQLSRHFEMGSNVLKAYDESLDLVINVIGEV